MQHRISELSGALLDAAVAKAMGRKFFTDDSGVWLDCYVEPMDRDVSACPFRPSLVWEHGGPIIERERIKLDPNNPPNRDGSGKGDWLASFGVGSGGFAYGQTPLIAAMRAYTASVFGDEVELP